MAKAAIDYRAKIIETIREKGEGATLAAPMPPNLTVWIEAATNIPPEVREMMPSGCAQLERLGGMIKIGMKISDLRDAMKSLEERIEDDLKSHWYYLVKTQLVGYYTEKLPLGQKVADRFPAAIDDIEEAAKCLALGRATACVLHLMRVMEAGLKELAAIKALGIPYAPSWEAYLRQIQAKIDTPRKKKSRDWIKLEPFLRDVSGDLLTVKQAWRNPTMHIVRKYSPDEAEEIFKAVRRFMLRLADELPPPKPKKGAKK